MTVLNTNNSATIASNALLRFDRDKNIAMDRLSTGLRVNTAMDDAAGLAVSERMRSVVGGMEQAARNSNDGISMLETVEGASLEIANILQRMRELAVQAASGTLIQSDRDVLDLEYGQLMTEITRIAQNTEWNTMSLMNGGNDATDHTVTNSSVTIQVGDNVSETMTLTFKSFDPQSTIRPTAIMQTTTPVRAFAAGAAVAGAANVAGYSTLGNLNHTTNDTANTAAIDTDTTVFGSAVLFAGNGGDADTRTDITTASNAGYVLTQLDIAISALSSERAKYASYINRLNYTTDSFLNIAQHTDQSRSVIADADYGVETSQLARQQILTQAGTAILAQANSGKEHVLTLLN